MNYIVLALCVILCMSVGFVSGQLTDTDSDWFNALEKPSFYPPGYLFGLVWTVLYIMMGVALAFVIEKTKEKLPLILFSVQLTLNFFWTLIFFGLQHIMFALIEIAALWGILLWTIFVFKKYSVTASYLLVPYLLWVSFATLLTASILFLN